MTDHLSLGNLFDSNCFEGKTSFHTRTRRAISILFEFNLKIIYFPGESELIKVVDGLSRNAKYITTPLKLYESELNMKIDLIKESEVNVIETIENLPNIPITPILTKQIILNAQKNDDEIRSIFERLKNLKTKENYFLTKKHIFYMMI